jgi:hypothetical protein
MVITRKKFLKLGLMGGAGLASRARRAAWVFG